MRALSDFESQLLLAADVAKKSGFDETYLALLDVLRAVRATLGEEFTATPKMDGDAGQHTIH
mgnify:CR=1 FL=1